MSATSADATDDKATCLRAMEIMAAGTVEDFAEVYTADALDREDHEHPPLRGPEGLHRSASRLRAAYSDMRGTSTPWCRTVTWSSSTRP